MTDWARTLTVKPKPGERVVWFGLVPEAATVVMEIEPGVVLLKLQTGEEVRSVHHPHTAPMPRAVGSWDWIY